MTQPTITHTFDAVPSLLRSYLRAAMSSKRGTPDEHGFTPIVLHLRGVHVSPARLQRYRARCGFVDDAQLPLPYPQVLATPLHMALLTHPAFPFKPAGIVHLRNTFALHGPIADHSVLDLQVRAQTLRRVDNGIEIDLATDVTDSQGMRLWESVTTLLVRGGKRERTPSAPRVAVDFSAYRPLAQWSAPESTGRAYAAASGDWNPIHLHCLTARAFGFPRAIAHGMWSFARCVAALENEGLHRAHWQVAFKRPLLLPGDVRLHLRRESDRICLLLSDLGGETVYLAAEADDGLTSPAIDP